MNVFYILLSVLKKNRREILYFSHKITQKFIYLFLYTGCF